MSFFSNAEYVRQTILTAIVSGIEQEIHDDSGAYLGDVYLDDVDMETDKVIGGIAGLPGGYLNFTVNVDVGGYLEEGSTE